MAWIKPEEYLALEEKASTKHEYLDEKFEAYQCIPTLEEYVLVSPRDRRVEVLRRAPGWIAQTSASGVVRLESLDVSLALEQFFDGLD